MRHIVIVVATLVLAACATKPPAALSQAAPAGAPSQYAYVVTPTPAPATATSSATAIATPQILEIDLNAQRYRAPQIVDVRVKTTADVSSVTVHLLGREAAVPKIAPGVFSAQRALPDVPFFLKGRTYGVQFVAATDDGRTTSSTVSVYLER